MGFWKDLLATHGHLPLTGEDAALEGAGASQGTARCIPPLRLVRLESEDAECPPQTSRSPRRAGGPVLGVHGLA